MKAEFVSRATDPIACAGMAVGNETSGHDLVRQVFDHAAELSPEDRGPYVQAAMAGHPELIERVEQLLEGLNLAPTTPVFRFTRGDQASGSGDAVLSDGDVIETPLGRARVKEFLSLRPGTQVFRVRLESRSDDAVLKLLLSGDFDYDAARRFRAEARMLGMLDHPGIVSYLAAGSSTSADGEVLPSLLTNYIEGVCLDQWVMETRPSARVATTLVARVARAMHHAHLRGVIHRDLKPSNILVDEGANPHVLDLGVARFLDGPSLSPDSTLATQGYSLVGTPVYMAPEQLDLDEGHIDLQCDVFALGAVLYELLTGRVPHGVEGLTFAEIRDRKRTSTPAPPAAEGVDRQLSDAVMLALHPDRAVRYDSCDAFATDLERALAGLPILRRPPGAARRVALWARRSPWLASALAATLFAVIAGLGSTSWQAAVARDQRDRAVAMFERTRAFATWVVFEMDRELALLPGASPLRRELIAEAAATLDELRLDESADPDLILEVAQARVRLGTVLESQLHDHREADAQFDEALELLTLHPEQSMPEVRLLMARSRSAISQVETTIHEDLPTAYRHSEETIRRGLDELRALVPDLGHDPRLWMWLADLQWRAARNVWYRRGDTDHLQELTRESIASAQRALALAPESVDALDVVLRCVFYDGYSRRELGDARGALRTMEEATLLADRLHSTGDPRGSLRKAQILTVAALSTSNLGAHHDAFAEAMTAVALADAAYETDREDQRMFRVREFARSTAISIFIAAAKNDGVHVAPPSEVVHLLEELRAMFSERIDLGWANSVELERYPSLFESLEVQLRDIDR